MPVASELLVKVNADVSNLESGLASANSQVSTFAKVAGGLGTVATTAFAALGVAAIGMGAGLVGAVNSAATFQQGIANVGALVGATSAQLAQLSAAALQLGQDTTLSGIGATDAAAAMEALATAGFSVADMTGGVTRGVLLLASATGTDVATAATIAGDAFNEFRTSMGLTAADMPHIADLFVGAANVSSIGLTDIGESMQYIGPIAASMGISIDQVTAALAELGNQGIKGSEAGTALRSILVSVTSPSKEAAKAISDLGLNFVDAGGNVKDFSGISEELKTKLAGLTDAQRAQALSTIFGREALAAATVLYGEGAKGIQDYITQIQQQGDAAAIGAQRNNTFSGALESLKGSVETAVIALGSGLLPALQGVAQRLAGGVSAAIPFITMIGQRLGSALVAAIGLFQRFGAYVSSAVGAVVDSFKKLQSGQITLAQFIGGIKNLIATVAGDLFGGLDLGSAATALGGALVSAFQAVAPIVLNELGILGGQIIAWLQANGPSWLAGLITAFQSAAPGVLSALGSLLTGLQSFAAQVIAAFQAAWPTILQVGSQLVAAFQAASGVIAPFLAGFGGVIVAVTAGAAAFGALMPIITAIGAGLAFLVSPLGLIAIAVGLVAAAWVNDWGGIQGIVASLIPVIESLWANIQAGIAVVLPILEQVGSAIMAGIGGAVQAIVPLVEGFFAAFQANLPALQALWTQLQATVQAAMPILEVVAGIIGGVIVAAIGVLMGAIGGLVGFLTGALPGAIQAVTGLLEGLGGVFDLVSSLVGGMVATVSALLNGDWSGAWQAAQEMVANVTAAIEEIVNGFGSATLGLFQALIGGVIAAVGGFVSTITGFFDGLLSSLTGTTVNIQSSVTNAFTSLISTVTSAVSGFVSSVVGFFQNLLSEATSAATNLQSAVVGAFNGLVSSVQGAMSSFVTAVSGGISTVLGLFSGLAGQITGAVGDLGGILVGAGKAVIDGLISGIKSGLGALGDALGGVGQFIVDHKGPPEKDAVMLFEAGQLIMQGLIDGIDSKQLDLEQKLADVTASIAKAATDMLGAFQAIASFDFAKNSPSGETMGWFMHLAISLVQNMAAAAALIGTDGLAAAKAAGEAMGGIGNAVKSSLEGLQALAQYDFTKGSPTGEAMGWFRHLMESIVLNFAQAADLVGTEGMQQAKDFASSVSDVVSATKSALDAFSALVDWKDKPTEALQAVWQGLEGALSAMGDLVTRSDALKNAAHDYLANMQETARLVLQAQSIGNGLGGVPTLPTIPTLPPGIDRISGIPALASGGIATRPTLALIGERGPEAVVPLSRYDRAGGGGDAYYITIAAPVYGVNQLEDVVIGAVNSAKRRGRF